MARLIKFKTELAYREKISMDEYELLHNRGDKK